MDYARLVLQRWDMGADRIPDLEVYGPPPIARMTDLLFGADGVYGPDIRARIEHQSSIDVFEARGGQPPRRRPAPRVREVHAGDVVEGRGWKVTVGHASHVQPQLECLAFRLDSDEGSVCYSGDSGACDELVELARGCDVLIHMNHHFSGTEPTASYRAGVRQPSRQRGDRGARGRQDPGAHAPARADRSARRPRADRPRDPAGVPRHRDLGRRSDAAHAPGIRGRDNRGLRSTCRPRRAPIPAPRSRARRRHRTGGGPGRRRGDRVPVRRIEAEQVLDEPVVALARAERAAGAVVGAGHDHQLERLARADQRVRPPASSTPDRRSCPSRARAASAGPCSLCALSTLDDAA